ncbi:hypothetical protein Lepto7376_2471 [[Leptolyngbya] sp. PCC 7376]|uniref:hypothetical protein n=1 Tax=[Leptolyngbya] sp. PCC 7376 TaxID=111781 RepID=UPI00029F0DD4|nr:hypothetical protein [[Leptolyngbya] sp. PCC 7376]AFY38750.1 hypothetical protein Lepto7376_2471 [[Leptolyngbya] sp. PCC 7376]
MSTMSDQPSLVEKWFPTFIKLFQRFHPPSDHPAPENRESQLRSKPSSKFFLHNLNGIQELESLSRERLLKTLQWISFSYPNQVYSIQNKSTEITNQIDSKDKLRQKQEVSENLALVENKESDFFIQGLPSLSSSSSLKGIELLHLLTWEEEGQTLLEIDADDYELLDDILNVPTADASIDKASVEVANISPTESVKDQSGFFIRGVAQTGSLENLQSTGLMQFLNWESQGQTLLDVDPDDYELLDDLLEAFPDD